MKFYNCYMVMEVKLIILSKTIEIYAPYYL